MLKKILKMGGRCKKHREIKWSKIGDDDRERQFENLKLSPMKTIYLR